MPGYLILGNEHGLQRARKAGGEHAADEHPPAVLRRIEQGEVQPQLVLIGMKLSLNGTSRITLEPEGDVRVQTRRFLLRDRRTPTTEPSGRQPKGDSFQPAERFGVQFA